MPKTKHTVSEPDFVIRRATWAQNQLRLRAVRQAVFVIEQGVPEALEWPEAGEGETLEANCAHWLAEDAQGASIGTARLSPAGQLGRMAVIQPWRGRGVGHALLMAVIAEAKSTGFKRVYLHAQTHAVAFYTRAGFSVSGQAFFEAGLPHRHMALALT